MENHSNRPDQRPSSEVEMLMDGTWMNVRLRPKKAGEAPESARVFVRKIPICDMQSLGTAFGKYAEEAGIYIDKPASFVREIEDEDFIAVFEEGRRLNFTSFGRWWDWQQQTLKALNLENDNPVVGQVVQKIIDQQKNPS